MLAVGSGLSRTDAYSVHVGVAASEGHAMMSNVLALLGVLASAAVIFLVAMLAVALLARALQWDALVIDVKKLRAYLLRTAAEERRLRSALAVTRTKLRQERRRT